MKHKFLVRIFVILCALLLLAAAAAVGLYYYVFSIPEPNGLSLASWPNRFTDNFPGWIEAEGNTVRVADIGLERLDEYGLCLQILDASGREAFSYRKPASWPEAYSAAELAALAEQPYKDGRSVFVSSTDAGAQTWTCLVGFPYPIGKRMIYYNGRTVGRLLPVFAAAAALILGIAAAALFLYGLWLTRRTAAITRGIEAASRREYQALPERGLFSDVNAALNQMDARLRHSEQLRSQTERERREWIANITHDLKTPLSPIRGYAELLADGSADGDTAREYGAVILKNAEHTQALINDLKLTYQLESGALPCRPRPVELIRYVKELLIDVANMPAFSDRDISFASDLPEFTAQIDPDLFRRALENLVINALIHNPPDIRVTVSVSRGEGGAAISIRDNGSGMSEAECARLFTRYYRGTSTQEKPEGSGLGLAIAKQIAMLHGGDITVRSAPGEGSEFILRLN